MLFSPKNKQKAITACVVSDAGSVRNHNEDNFLFAGQTAAQAPAGCVKTQVGLPFVCCVCDGMGGEYAGDAASATAVAAIRGCEGLLAREHFSPQAAAQALLQANNAVFLQAQQAHRTMGSTVALCAFSENTVTVANLGDSRVYRFSNNTLQRLSVDHTQARLLIAAGVMSEEQAKHSPASHVLTQYLGMDASQMIPEPAVSRFPTQAGDVFLLCSDGLYDEVEESQISQILKQGLPALESANALLSAALANGGADNITIIVIQL